MRSLIRKGLPQARDRVMRGGAWGAFLHQSLPLRQSLQIGSGLAGRRHWFAGMFQSRMSRCPPAIRSIKFRDNVRLPISVQEFGNDSWTAADSLFNPAQEVIKRHLRILLARHYKERVHIFLPGRYDSLAFLRSLGHKDDRID